MEDLVCYEIIFDGENKPLYCIGISEKDIVSSVSEWSPKITSMKYIGEGYVAVEAGKYVNE
jgi:hypothetical protein